MFFVSNISRDEVFVTDTSDNTVEKYTKNDLQQIMLKNPDISIKGVGIAPVSFNEFSFRIVTYELSDTEKARLAGAKPPITRFCRLPEDKQARNHYYCSNCDSLLSNDKPTRCPRCHKGILYPSGNPVSNFTTDWSGTRYFYTSINDIRNMLKDKVFKYA